MCSFSISVVCVREKCITGMGKLVECPASDFGSVHDPTAMGLSPALGFVLSMDST